MEELRSTEILDKEIQEDARKKAERILKNADAECESIEHAVKQRIETAHAEKQTYYANRLEMYQRDVGAAIPLEKDRFLVSFVDRAVVSAIELYIKSLSNEKRFMLIVGLVVKAKSVLEGKKAHISINGFEKKEIEKLLQKEYGSHFVESMLELDDARALDKNAYRGMVIETSDNMIRYRATLNEIINEIMDEKRGELAESLFGGRLSQ